MTWLVTGAAGYIGRHLLHRTGDWIGLDIASPGPAMTAPIHHVDITDSVAVRALFEQHAFEGVVHLAALKSVADSVANPAEYERVNVDGLRVLLDAMVEADVPRLVFASSAAVYGTVDVHIGASISETADTHPANPYGASKLAGETLVGAFAHGDIRSAVILRTFNAAGTSVGRAGEGGLVERAVAAACDGRALTVFGTDYPTPDGTCVRDFVHVDDIVDAIEAAMAAGTPGALTVNIGTGIGTSVLDVARVVGLVAGRPLPVTRAPARAGDVPIAVADASAAAAALGWRASRGLPEMVSSTWDAACD